MSLENLSVSSSPASTSPTHLQEDSKWLLHVLDEMGSVIVGQEHMNRSLLLGLITGGHVLVEGLPGLAKTLAVKTLAQVVDCKFQRVQFTPDLLPSDLIGTLIYRESTGEFVPKKGPIFANIVLADEINRAPAKVQSALLEAMAEKQVTIGETTYPLEDPFLVLATQNPIEQEGTYHLPEAQLDRFMFKLKVSYPSREEERMILDRMTVGANLAPKTLAKSSKILEIRKHLSDVYLDERIKNYILRLIMATRHEANLEAHEADPTRLKDLRSQISIGASPRATLFLQLASRAHALFEERHFVTPDDIKAVAPEVLRHRLILGFDAEAKGLTTDNTVEALLKTVVVP